MTNEGTKTKFWTETHASSESVDWATPQELFDRLDARFHFTLDVCASDSNHKTARYYTELDDGLAQTWEGVCWMNPPYGKTIAAWMRKAVESAAEGATVVCLVPARTDTAWFQDFAFKGAIVFLRGRVKFGGHKDPAPFPSAIVILGPGIPPGRVGQMNLKEQK